MGSRCEQLSYAELDLAIHEFIPTAALSGAHRARAEIYAHLLADRFGTLAHDDLFVVASRIAQQYEPSWAMDRIRRARDWDEMVALAGADQVHEAMEKKDERFRLLCVILRTRFGDDPEIPTAADWLLYRNTWLMALAAAASVSSLDDVGDGHYRPFPPT